MTKRDVPKSHKGTENNNPKQTDAGTPTLEAANKDLRDPPGALNNLNFADTLHAFLSVFRCPWQTDVLIKCVKKHPVYFHSERQK